MSMHRHLLLVSALLLSCGSSLATSAFGQEVSGGQQHERLREEKDKVTVELQKLRESIQTAQGAINRTIKIDIQKARDEVREQMTAVREVIDSFSNDSPLSKSINDLYTWASFNRARALKSETMAPDQKAKITQMWDNQIAEIERFRAEYIRMAKALSQRLSEFKGQEEYLSELLLLRKGNEAIQELNKLIIQMRQTIDTINNDNQKNKIIIENIPQS